MSSMKYADDSRGSVATILAIVLLGLLLIGALGFGFWAYSGRQDFKNNADQKVAAAVQANTKKVQQADALQYAEEAKNPLKTYTGPAEFGSLRIQYPKTWSAYVALGSNYPVDGYFAPDYVPSVQSQSSTFALRAQIVTTSYSDTLRQFTSLQQQGKVSVQPYAFPKVTNVVGSRVDGQIAQNKQGSMIVVPLRDKTLKIWTESDAFKHDFETYILPNLTFSP